MKNTKNRNNIYIYIFIYLAIAAFYLWMAAQIPYTHDDWDWGLDVGMQQFLHATVNSRYAGNFFEIVMTRSEFLKVVIMGTTYFLIPYLLTRVAAEEQEIVELNRKLLLFLLCNCMLLTMNHVMWREVYGWTAGFANFGISAVFLLLWIKELCRIFDCDSEECKGSFWKILLYFAASFCGQLFIENLAIYCVILACVLCGINYYRFRRVPYRVLAMGIGAVSGLIVMFSSSLYKTLFTTGYAVGGYRVIPMIGFDSFVHAFSALKGQILNLAVRLYFNNIALSLLVLVVILCRLHCKREEINMRLYISSTISNCALLIGFGMWYIYDERYAVHAVIASYIQFALAVIYLFIIAVEIFFCFGKEKRGTYLALWLSPPVVIAPLLMTGEYGQRLFFTTNIFVLLFVLILVADLLKSSTFLTLKRFWCLVASAAILLFGFYGNIYRDIGECKTEREMIIREAVAKGQDTIVLPAFPYEEYLHGEKPTVEWRELFFKDFYGIPADIEIRFK